MRDALPYPMPTSERISFVYFEHKSIDRDGSALVAFDKAASSQIEVPIGRTLILMLGPGCRISHAGVALCALEGATLLWVGESAVRLYAAANPRSDAKSLLRQASMRLDETKRLAVAKRIFFEMFQEQAPDRRSIEQIRGIEGARVKAIYENLAKNHQVKWVGRTQDMGDPLNAAVSTATSALYGLCEAVILALGYSPAIGFMHDGDPRSFVFDLADTIKFKSVVPLAFDVFSESPSDIERRVRIACRNLFFKESVAEKLVLTLERLFCANGID